MNTQEIKNIINQYFDNELTKAEEVILFTQLSEDEDAREYFKQMNLLRNVTDASSKDYPQYLDAKILSNIQIEETPKINNWFSKNIFSAISYAVALVLLALSIFFYTESLQYRNMLKLTNQQVEQQNKLIQVLYNTLPPTIVTEKVKNEIIITPQM